MTVNIESLINKLIEDQAFDDVIANPALQLGMPPQRPFLMSSVLPERTVSENAFRDTLMAYRTHIANDATRYSPVQFKGSAKVGEALFELTDSDIGSQFTGREYDVLVDKLMRTEDMQSAATTLLDFVNRTVAIPLAAKRELQRCQAVVYGEITREGDNELLEKIQYPVPAGTRVTVEGGTEAAPAGELYDDTKDPAESLAERIDQREEDLGLEVSQIITTRKIMRAFRRNDTINKYGVSVVANQDGSLATRANTPATQAVLNAFATHDLPMPMMYDLSFPRVDGTQIRMIPDNVLIVLFQTGQMSSVFYDIDEANDPYFLYDTLGYTAIGRPVGQQNPGIASLTKANLDDKPPNLAFKGWQTTLPIIQMPEAILVITYEDPTPA